VVDRKKMEQARLAAEAARQARVDLFVAAGKGDVRWVEHLCCAQSRTLVLSKA
jgi:hypothetical protein